MADRTFSPPKRTRSILHISVKEFENQLFVEKIYLLQEKMVELIAVERAKIQTMNDVMEWLKKQHKDDGSGGSDGSSSAASVA